MPILPPIAPGPPVDEVDTILNFARLIANDCGISLSGNLLADSQPYTFPMLNLAYRKLQDRLGNNAVEDFPQEIIFTAIPAQYLGGLQDPSIMANLGFQGYNDGGSIYTNFVLPQDLQVPLRLWERVTGTNQVFLPMRLAIDGIEDRPKSGMMHTWEWRDSAIWFPGANQTLDIRLRYRRFLQDLPDSGTAPVPLIRCAVALAYLVVEIFAASRGSTILPVFQQEKEDAIKQLINITTRKKQRVNYRRIPYSRRGSHW